MDTIWMKALTIQSVQSSLREADGRSLRYAATRGKMRGMPLSHKVVHKLLPHASSKCKLDSAFGVCLCISFARKNWRIPRAKWVCSKLSRYMAENVGVIRESTRIVSIQFFHFISHFCTLHLRSTMQWSTFSLFMSLIFPFTLIIIIILRRHDLSTKLFLHKKNRKILYNNILKRL